MSSYKLDRRGKVLLDLSVVLRGFFFIKPASRLILNSACSKDKRAMETSLVVV